jgi:drug/metabolite transporter (DMT)-like permease
MFFLLAVLAMIAYSVQGTLISHHARKHDGLSISIYRNLSLAVTMIPLLFLASRESFASLQDTQVIIEFLIAGATGASALALSLWAVKFLPVGIKTVFGRLFSVVIVFILGFVFFGEIPFWEELFFVTLILIAGGCLAMQKNKFEHLDNNVTKGVLITFVSAVLAGFSFYFMSKLSREIDPFLSGYVWETLIGLFALLFGILRSGIGHTKIAKISWKEFGVITLVSWPTLVGTGAFAYAVTLGPMGIVNAIGAGGILVSILIAHFLYNEKLIRSQLFWVLVILVGLVGLKLMGS